MMIQGVSIPEMINQSITVLTKPSIATFEQFEKRGGQREGLVYVGAAAAISAVVALLTGLLSPLGIVGGIVTAIFAAIIPVAAYFIFCTLVYMMGSNQGGTGSREEVFYSMALFIAPLQAINGVVSGAVNILPLLACVIAPLSLLLLVYQVYLGYLSVRSSMNLDQNKAIITMVVAAVGQFVATAIIGAISAAVLIGVGVTIPGVVPPTP